MEPQISVIFLNWWFKIIQNWPSLYIYLCTRMYKNVQSDHISLTCGATCLT